MKIFDDIKEQIPMDKIKEVLTFARGKLPAYYHAVYPGYYQAQYLIKRIHFLLEENANMTLGKQDIFKREIHNEDGTSKTYTYTVDFNDVDQVKRLRDILTELIDLADEDAAKSKKEAIPGYLDYIAMASA